MQNPNNVLIRTLNTSNETLSQLAAWCEICGAKNLYGNMYHCFEHDVICCLTEGCYSQINQENAFKCEGFYHVTRDGMIEFWQLLNDHSTSELLYDIKPATKINALMQSQDFDLDAHIKTNFPTKCYDDMLYEIESEIAEAITALEFAFTTKQTKMHFNGRTIANIDAIPEYAKCNSNMYYPITTGVLYTTIDDLGVYCMDATCERVVSVTVKAFTDETVNQEFTFLVGGAQDFNILSAIIDAMENGDCDYTRFEFIAA